MDENVKESTLQELYTSQCDKNIRFALINSTSTTIIVDIMDLIGKYITSGWKNQQKIALGEQNDKEFLHIKYFEKSKKEGIRMDQQ